MDDDHNPGTACTPCRLASYASGYGNTECNQCPSGKVTMAEGSPSLADCIITGCTDSWSLSYNPLATGSNGSCAFTCAHLQMQADAPDAECIIYERTIRDWVEFNPTQRVIFAIGVPTILQPDKHHLVVGVSTRFGSKLVVDGANLTLRSARMSSLGNAHSPGGACSVSDSHTRLDFTSFTSNTGSTGGAIFSDGAVLTVANTGFASNRGTFGGAIHAILSTLIVEHGVFDSNRADSAGGAIYTVESQLLVASTVFVGNQVTDGNGGAIYVATTSPTVLDDCKFLGSVAGDLAADGAGLYGSQSTIIVTNSMFKGLRAAGIGGGAYAIDSRIRVANTSFVDCDATRTNLLYMGQMAEAMIYNTSFVPFASMYGEAVSLGGVLGGCREHPCDVGHSCTYSAYSLSCQPCVAPTVGQDGIVCSVCAPGEGPNEARTGCSPCEQEGQISKFGAECVDCPPGFTSDVDHTECIDVDECATDNGDCDPMATAPSCSNEQGSRTCGSCPDGVLGTADLLVNNGTGCYLPVVEVTEGVQDRAAVSPQVSLELAVTRETLSDPVTRQSFVNNLVAEMALALQVDVSEIVVEGLREGGRRRLAEEAVAVAFDFTIAPSNALAALAELKQQLADPESALMQAAPIAPDQTLEVVYVCPVGMTRAAGDSLCQKCPSPQFTPDRQTCRECPVGRTPTSVGDACQCASGYYNVTSGFAKCYAEGQDFELVPQSEAGTTDDCQTCALMSCITCDEGKASVAPGYAVLESVALSADRFDSLPGQRAVFPCPMQESCTAASEDGFTDCLEGYAGPLCDTCADGWSRPGLAGDCSQCDETASMVWLIVGSLIALVSIVGSLFYVSSHKQNANQQAATTRVVTLAKIAISLFQVLAQLDFTMDIDWPKTFRWFVDWLQLISFDMLAFLDIGCVGSYTYFQKCAFAFLVLPIMLGSIGLLYEARKDQEGMSITAVRMALTTTFLCFPFVAQTMFQGQDCRDLGEDESYLAVDYQIDCDSTSYYFFFTLSSVGIILYPIGVPTATFALLFKNGDELRQGGPAQQTFDFLIADYKPSYYYWDTLDMFR